MAKNRGASVRRKLLNEARSSNGNYNQLLDRYFRERFLYRLSQSPQADRFILKGASVFQVWLGNPHRTTKDVDLLGFGSNDPEELKQTFSQILQQSYDDGIEFSEIESSVLQAGHKYEGIRLDVKGRLDTARLKLQVDIGYGHVVTPRAKKQTVPTLLDLPSPNILVYPKETVVAEKFEAICDRGLENSRVKDYFDLFYIKNNFSFDSNPLQQAISNTFSMRDTPLPGDKTPVGLSDLYIESNPTRQNQWQKIGRQSKVDDIPAFKDAIPQIADFLMPVVRNINQKATVTKQWQPEKGWLLVDRFQKIDPLNKKNNSRSQIESNKDLDLE